MTLTFMIYGTDIGEIYATFGTYTVLYMKRIVSIRYDLGNVKKIMDFFHNL